MKSTTIIFVSIAIAVIFIIGIVAFGKNKENINISLPIEIEVYSDFQCPHCRDFALSESEVKDHFGEDVNFVHKQFPLGEEDSRSFAAAIASEAAREQGRFEEYYGLLFENQPPVSAFEDEDFLNFATELELDIGKFQNDYEDNQELKARVLADKEEGKARGVSGTPAIFVNDKQYANIGGTSKLIEHLQKLVDSAKMD